MILECEKCKTQFAVPDGAIKPEGRKVKCSSCGHVWHQMPVSPKTAPKEAAANIEEEAKRKEAEEGDAPTEREKTLWRPVAACLLIFNLFLSAYTYQHKSPILEEVFTQLGLNPIDGLVFANVNLDYQAYQENVMLYLTGSVVNESETAKALPAIHISIWDQEDKEIFSRPVTLGKRILEPGEQASLPSEIGPIPDVARTLVLDIGNAFEIMAR